LVITQIGSKLKLFIGWQKKEVARNDAKFSIQNTKFPPPFTLLNIFYELANEHAQLKSA